MRFTLSRRTLLLTGATGASLSLLTACGLRLDTPPEVPDLSDVSQLRNKVARILEATTPDDSDPDSATALLKSFTDAIGPVWSPPSAVATAPPPSAEPRNFMDAAEEVSKLVFGALPQQPSKQFPVLADVAIGFTVTAGALEPKLVEAAEKRLRASLNEPENAHHSPPSQESADPASVFAELLQCARAAGYGYESLAVHFAKKSPERKEALARLETLGSLAGEMLEMLKTAGVDPEPDSPAWNLEPAPTDAQSARDLALALEDTIASAILPWLAADSLATFRLWQSARTRSVFGTPQALRYSTEGAQPTEAEDQS